MLFLNFNPHVALGLYTCMYNSCWDRDLLHYIRKKKAKKNVNDQGESLGYYQTSCVDLKGSGLQTPWENLKWIYRHLTPFETPLAFKTKARIEVFQMPLTQLPSWQTKSFSRPVSWEKLFGTALHQTREHLSLLKLLPIRQYVMRDISRNEKFYGGTYLKSFYIHNAIFVFLSLSHPPASIKDK